MKPHIGRVVVGFLSLALSVVQLTFAQLPTETASALPRLVRFSGVAKDLNGNPLTGVVGITFALYTEQTGGAPLWLETQNVTADSNGHYTTLLGSTKPAGLPADLFTTEQARWVGVQISGQTEQPRVLLVSAPYALKAGDAETIGGLPPSAFMLVLPSASRPATATGPATNSEGVGPDHRKGAQDVTTTGGTANYLPVFNGVATIIDSAVYQSGTGGTAQIGINTTTPTTALDVNGAVNAATSYNLGGTAFAYGSYANYNASLGFAGNSTMTGDLNTATGGLALAANTSGNSNTASGFGALRFNTTGFENTAIGIDALLSNTAGVYNTASGANALSANTTGNFNTASGIAALNNNTTGEGNTALGVNAGITADRSNGTGSNNTAVGTGTVFGTGSLSNATAIGASAEVTESNALVLGSVNGVNGATSNVNVGIGTTAPVAVLDAEQSGTARSDGTFRFLQPGLASGNDNSIAWGKAAAAGQTGLQWFMYVSGGPSLFGWNHWGDRASLVVQQGGNVGVGTMTPGTTLDVNGKGRIAGGLDLNAAGSFVGFNRNVSTGAIYNPSYNAFQVGQNEPDQSFQIMQFAANGTAMGAPFYVASNGNVTLAAASGANVSIGTQAPLAVFTIVQGGGPAISDGWTTYSSRRWKENIRTLHGAMATVAKLRGVSYDLRANGKHEVGVIAEEVGAVVPEVVTWEKNGKDAQSVDYGRLTALLIEAAKEQQALIREQKEQIRAQQAQIARLTRQVKTIQATLKAKGGRGSAIRTVKAEATTVRQ